MERLDKILSNRGAGSRKECTALIRSGSVLVDGEIIRKPDFKADPEKNEIVVNGKRLDADKYIYLMMNKPAGVVCASEDRTEKTVLDILPEEYCGRGLSSVGRLDKDTTGLLLLTNDGDFLHRVISPRSKVYKLYLAELDGDITDDDVKAFEEGIELSDGKCLPAKLEKAGEKLARVEICEGRYHQVKRMFRARGLTVTKLKRERIGGLSLPVNLHEGFTQSIAKNEKTVIFLVK